MYSVMSAYVIVDAIRSSEHSWVVKSFTAPFATTVSRIHYPIFSVRSYFGNLERYEGIWGLQWLASEYPDNYAAIQWLNIRDRALSPLPVIVEADAIVIRITIRFRHLPVHLRLLGGPYMNGSGGYIRCRFTEASGCGEDLWFRKLEWNKINSGNIRSPVYHCGNAWTTEISQTSGTEVRLPRSESLSARRTEIYEVGKKWIAPQLSQAPPYGKKNQVLTIRSYSG